MIIEFPDNAPPTARVTNVIANVFESPNENVQRMMPTRPTTSMGFRPIVSASIPSFKHVNIWTKEKVLS